MDLMEVREGYWILTNQNIYALGSEAAAVGEMKQSFLVAIPLNQLVQVEMKSEEIRFSSQLEFIAIVSTEKGLNRLFSTLGNVLLTYYHQQLVEMGRNKWGLQQVAVDEALSAQGLASLAATQSKSIGYINSSKGQQKQRKRDSKKQVFFVLGVIIAIIAIGAKIALTFIK